MALIPSSIVIELLTDTTFGAGLDPAGPADVEVVHDELGLPYLPGSTLRSLLRDQWRSIGDAFASVADAAARCFGRVGAVDEGCILHVGDATIDDTVVALVRAATERPLGPLSPSRVLEASTVLRAQTAIDPGSGAAVTGSLRTTRALRAGTVLRAPLTWLERPAAADVAVLAAAVLALRGAGLSRTRGRGRLRCSLDGARARTIEAVAALAEAS